MAVEFTSRVGGSGRRPPNSDSYITISSSRCVETDLEYQAVLAASAFDWFQAQRPKM